MYFSITLCHIVYYQRANGTANVIVSHGGTQFSYWCQSIA